MTEELYSYQSANSFPLSPPSTTKTVFKDIRLENIFVNLDVNATIADFWIAKILEAEKNSEKMIEYAGDYPPPNS